MKYVLAVLGILVALGGLLMATCGGMLIVSQSVTSGFLFGVFGIAMVAVGLKMAGLIKKRS